MSIVHGTIRTSLRRLMHSLAACGFGMAAACSASAAEEAPIEFSRDILPILSDRCFQCHGPDERARKAGLRLDTKEGAFHTDEEIAIIASGKSEGSELYLRVSSSDPNEIMPPPDLKRPMTPKQIDKLRRWIDAGAPWGAHWAFEPPRRPALPPVAQSPRVTNPIDRFILARLDKEGRSPSPEAPRETLLRRVTLDLTGLPPTSEEADAFLGDTAPGAYERVVDRLLGSPAFGERMAWEWLDAARYADSNGYQGDAERTMWPWRDWVVEAFNRNLPYDQFTLWQLAGDLLPEATLEQRLATGFNRNHMINGEGGRIPEENRVDYVMDMAETMGTVWLGLTLNCSRCHDHKYDPITQRDYFGLYAFFDQTPVTGAGGDPQSPPRVELPTPAQKEGVTEAQSAIRTAAPELEAFERDYFPREEGRSAADSERAAELPDNIKNILKNAPAQRNGGQLSELEKHFEAGAPDYAARLKPLREAVERRDRITRSIVRVMVMEEMREPRKSFVLDTGLYDKPRDEISANVPGILPPLPPGDSRNRLALARWLVSPDHPLTARVTVNRLWQQFFGTGLVKTPEEFGVQGEFPSHPELLDWLASEFIRSEWDLKQMVRLIVTSATYRQSSQTPPELAEIDPENRLLARAPRFRMPSWMIRDQALAAGGLLVRQTGGAPVRPYQPPGVWEEATFGNKRYQQDKGALLYRRSLYTFWRRIIGPTLFFDAAPRQVCSVKQLRTNSPLHALATLNDITYIEAARALAERALTGEPGDPLERAFRLVLTRPPTAEERSVLAIRRDRLRREFAADPGAAGRLLNVGEHPRDPSLDPVEHAAMAGVCLILLNLDETLTKE